MCLWVLGGEPLGQFRRDLPRGDTGLLGGDLLRCHSLLMLSQFGDRLAVLDRVLDELFHGVQVCVANRGQLDRWQVEVVLDTVLDPDRHQRVQAEFDQRNLPRQVLGFVAHRAADDRRQPVVHGFTAVRRPFAQIRRHPGARGQVVAQNRRRTGGGIGIHRRMVGSTRHVHRNRLCHSGSGRHRHRKRRGRVTATHNRVIDQGEGLVDTGVHLHRSATGMPGQGGHQSRARTGHRPLLGGTQRGIRKHLHRSGFDERGQIGWVGGGVLPDMPAVRHGHMGTRDERRAIRGEPRVEPVLLTLEPSRRNIGEVLRARGGGKQGTEVQIVSVNVELGHGRHHGVDLVLFAGQGGDQLPVMQTGCRRGQSDLHQRHRVRCQFQEGGVPVVHRVADTVGEVHAVAQALLPVVDIMDSFAGPDVPALVHGGEVADGQRPGFDTLQFGRQFPQQRIHLGGVAGPFGLEFAGEPTLGLTALDDRIHLSRRAADNGLGRGGVDADLQIREVGEDVPDLVGGVLDEGHQPDVLAEQHRLALTHQVRAGADGAGGIGQRQTAGEVGGRSLPE